MILSTEMNQLCKVCGEPAAGFHFGAFTCEGCKSFFGRTYNNLQTLNECKNQGRCIIDKKNRTSCKACRLKKCFIVGMSKSGSRYGRRSNWFKMHCLLQEQAAKHSGGDGLQNTLTFSGNIPFSALFNLHDNLKIRKDGLLSPSVLGQCINSTHVANQQTLDVDLSTPPMHRNILGHFNSFNYSTNKTFSLMERTMPFVPSSISGWPLSQSILQQNLADFNTSSKSRSSLKISNPNSRSPFPQSNSDCESADNPIDLSLKNKLSFVESSEMIQSSKVMNISMRRTQNSMPLDLSRKAEIR